ncbi:hypothetical protein ACIRLA_41290 [Streptomyces sp. NPDC102364]|uniref:hypothetical protein n=1 Tax=Streptomyces sp. NPDC102364 TaxID=3366161 RepID=UPI00382F84F5
MRTQDRRGTWDGRGGSGSDVAKGRGTGPPVGPVSPGSLEPGSLEPGSLEPGRLLGHARAALDEVVAAAGAVTPGAAGLQAPDTAGAPASGARTTAVWGTLGAAASDAVAACYLDLWICDRLLRHDGGNRSAAARCLVPVLLLEGVGGLTPVLGARLHRPDSAALAYRRRRRALVGAVRERSPRAWDLLGERLARIAAGEDRLARPLTPVRCRALPKPLSQLVGLLEAERCELVARSAELADSPLPYGVRERCALLVTAAACLDGWQGPGPQRDPHARRDTVAAGTGRPTGHRSLLALPGPAHSGPGHPLGHPHSVSLLRARLCAALHRLAVRLDLRMPDAAHTAWRADVLRCAAG